MASVTMSAPIVRYPAARRFHLSELAFIVPWRPTGGKRASLLFLARDPERHSAPVLWGFLAESVPVARCEARAPGIIVSNNPSRGGAHDDFPLADEPDSSAGRDPGDAGAVSCSPRPDREKTAMAENANTFLSISPVSFPQALAAALRVLTTPALAGRVYLQGGLVPWAASGRDSGRTHGDVDVSVCLGDMTVVRAWLASEGLHDPALDSLELLCNDRHGDFGVHVVMDGVLVSFCPFYFEGCELRQRNAALVATDGFDALLEAAIPGVAEGDLFEERELPGGASIGCATLESVRAAKVASGREKDAIDVAEIDRMGCDPVRYARVTAAYAAMRIACVAHGE